VRIYGQTIRNSKRVKNVSWVQNRYYFFISAKEIGALKSNFARAITTTK
jgi:hypothetical protein